VKTGDACDAGRVAPDGFARLKPLETGSRCNVCGGAEWEDYDHTVVVLPVKGHGVLLGDGVRCLVKFCRVCGHARFHSRAILGEDEAD
jgi:hypothetical protein